MSMWQSIDTAPQDGKTKLILAAWSKDCKQSTIGIGVLEPYGSTQGDTTKPRALSGMAIFYPTHWLPLPEPPPC